MIHGNHEMFQNKNHIFRLAMFGNTETYGTRTIKTEAREQWGLDSEVCANFNFRFRDSTALTFRDNKGIAGWEP